MSSLIVDTGLHMKRAIVGLIALASLAAAGPARADWQVAITTDPITDTAKGRVWTENEQGIFQLQCDSEGWGISYAPRVYLGGRGQMGTVILRFDRDEPRKQTWRYISSLAGTVEMKYIQPVVERLITAQTFTVRARKFDGADLDATFDIAGYNAAFVRIHQVCPH